MSTEWTNRRAESAASDARRAFGRRGEALARAQLEKAGWRVVAQNYATRWGEIDLIAEDAGALVFVEVKARRSFSCGTPAEAVDARKRRKIVLAAQCFLQARAWEERPCRFDVVEVYERADGSCEMRRIADAFAAE